MVEPIRIAIFGPESTGKTSLAQALAAHFQEPCAPEYVRAFWDQHAGVITAADLPAIARGQMEAEDAAATRARRRVFADTELLTNVLWADLLFPGACEPWVRQEADARARRFRLYLLCGTDVPFSPDPQRCFPDDAGREMCARLWRETLEQRALPFIEIRGDWSERERRAIAAVTALSN
jgi:NadR type nicotinamide-nucleotide adenylyltransferase